MDPNQVGPCGPGVESIEVVDETHFKAKAKVGIGFISARFNIDMEIAERDEPTRAVIKARGPGAGSAVDATATMALRDGDGGGTTMDWGADVLIGGTLARRRAAHRGHREQDDRPDIRLHPLDAGSPAG